MSSNYDFSGIESNKICRVCLTSGDNVYAMTNSEIFAYREVIPTSTYKVVCNYSDMFMCIYCSYLLRKIQKFIHQCLRAEDILTNCYEQDSKLHTHKLHNFTTNTVTHKFPDEDESDRDYDDDVPLVMFKTDEEPVKKKKKAKKVKSEKQLEAIKMEPSETQDDTRQRQKKTKLKRQKVVKEGFSSRMVQETNEYVVIKLTKEQVLKEMEEYSKSEEYQRSLYKCGCCVKWFNFEEVLLKHMQKHTPESGSLKCDICSQYCPSAVSLRGHMKSHTTRYSCKVCGLVRRARQHLLEHHAIAHTDNSAVYRCNTCPFTTNKRTVMQRHGRSHLTSSRFPCERCGALFKSYETLVVHMHRHSRLALQCAECGAAFALAAALRRHQRSAHAHTDYYCVECDLKFKTPDNLRIHFKRAKRHRDASSYKHSCPQCAQKFMTLSSLTGHLSSAHGLPKEHSCDTCHREYSTRSALRAHVRSAHSPHKPVETCRVCSRTFTRKSVLCAHERTHSGAQCGATFAQAATLRAHKHAQKEKCSLIDEIAQDIQNEG
ncbi:zinc finger protein ZFP2-like isoform X2 [Plodia interpunctella]|uniref:zinc finger protein ZFP2-like isoform X2 n=1 Tax=Plodia interpunctella TaxID=58824 RepID=UPI002367BBB4|nr:zinc finger protein ZFP2-like isoform X2 [Plodia interpunctella]